MGASSPSLTAHWLTKQHMMTMANMNLALVLLTFHGGVFCLPAQTEISDEQLRAIHNVTDIDQDKAFRCGLFFPPEVQGKLPIAALFIFNSSFPADECPTEKQERFVSFCHSLWEKILKYVVYTNPSLKKERAEKGVTIGDDICSLIKKKVRAPFVGPKSKKFPKGLTIGMYANSCGHSQWTDTQDRHPQRVCCWQGKYKKCPE